VEEERRDDEQQKEDKGGEACRPGLPPAHEDHDFGNRLDPAKSRFALLPW
jgi:hypothetical protein